MKLLEPLPLKVWKSRQYRAAALDYATRRAKVGEWVEAGVADGWSARFIHARLKPGSRLSLFDSFQGLPADWGKSHPAGTFAAEPPKFDDPRVRVYAGMFDDTIPEFVRQRSPGHVTFIHVDCDLYDSTMSVLRGLAPMIHSGCVIAFDEAQGLPEAEEHEGRAMRDWQQESGRELEMLAYTEYTQLVTVVR